MVRSGKIDDIRRLVANAMSMCDTKDLAPAKRFLGSALSSLENLREERRVRRKSEAGAVGKLANPRMAIAQLESMIKKDKEKIILPEDGGLLNG